MVPAMDEDHLKVVCRMIEGVSTKQMRQELEEHEREHGPHSYVHWPKGAQQEPTYWPPQPEWKRAESIVSRRQAHAEA